MYKGKQRHLDHKTQVDLGSFYTPKPLVDIAFNLLVKHLKNTESRILLDSSCGYGSFLNPSMKFKSIIGADIDPSAAMHAQENAPKATIINNNSLQNIDRKCLDISSSDQLVIIGNPPYNDTTSIIRHRSKDKTAVGQINPTIKARDLGLSFLLSYNHLEAEYISVLHPLSYLIKPTNFRSLKDFTKNYRLIDELIVSSHEFSDTSRSMAFPIIIALYRRDTAGMDYSFIQNYPFKVKEGGVFRLAGFDSIANYLQKYPNKSQLKSINQSVAKFWTMRDINALKRNRTFIDTDSSNAVYVTREQLPYYCYVDVFKQYADKLPYFLGNCDVLIDNDAFIKIKDSFVYHSLKTNSILQKSVKFHEVPNAKQTIESYFKTLITKNLGENYAKNFN